MIAGAEHCGPGGCKLRIAGVSKVFDGRSGKVVALEGINLNIRGGEFVCLVGASGCGKTSLLNIIAGLEFPSSGVVELDGEPVTGPGRDRTVMFQESALFPWLDVMGNVMFGLNLVPGLTRGDRLAMAEKNLELVGLKECAHAHIHELSGGMKQRIVIAIALACNPSLLIADEPTTALDVTIQAQILHMIEELKRERNTSMILITHDLGIVVEMCSKVAIMYAGEIVESGTVEDIYGARQHPYTIGLFDSVPNLEDEQERLTPINGLMPDPVNLPKGCKFHPRCPYATERCKKEQPANVEVSSGHFVQCHMAKVAEKEE